MKTKEIHDDMVKTLGEDFPCYSTVKKWVKWVADCRRNRESTDDDAWTRRPKSATTDAQVEGIHHMVMNDRPACDCQTHIRDSGRQSRVGSYYFDRNLGDEQAVCQIGTPNADTRPKAEQS